MTKEIFELGVPIFGICYGAQFMVYGLGGTIGKANENAAAEFGRHSSANLIQNVPYLTVLRKTR